MQGLNQALTILMLATSYPKWPGEPTAPFIEEIAAGLVARGHTVHVLLPHHPELRRMTVERGVHLHSFRYAPHPSMNVWGYASALKADVGLKGAALGVAPFAVTLSLLALLRLTGPHQGLRFDLIHAHWVLPNGPPAMLAARRRRLPLVVSLHGSDVYMAEKGGIFQAAAAAAFQAAGAITACSGDLARRAIAIGAPAERTSVVPYGVDTEAFQPDPHASMLVRNQLGLPTEAPLVVSIGRLVYKKGLSYLIEAWPLVLEQHPDATLVIAGYGDLREELERLVREHGIAARVRFTGQLERNQAADLIAAADVYVVPSIRDQGGNTDGLPNTLLEGMSAARPIVASAIAGIPDVITDHQHGLLVPERDAQALAQCIHTLLADRSLAAQLGNAARQRILTELTWQCTAEQYEAAYYRALSVAR